MHANNRILFAFNEASYNLKVTLKTEYWDIISFCSISGFKYHVEVHWTVKYTVNVAIKISKNVFFIIVSSKEIFIARFPSVIYFTSGLKPLNHLHQWDVNPKLMLLFPALENSYVNLIRVLIGNYLIRT